MAASLYIYALRHTKRQQIWMLVVVLLSIPVLFVSLDLPKLIVNGPIQGKGFADGATQTYLRTALPLPEWLFGTDELLLFRGLDFNRLEALYVLSGLFLALVIINGAFKYYINTYKGRLGERMLRRMRYEFVDLVLRFPLARLRQLRPPEVASMIKDELEPIGGFIGDAFVEPLYLISQILTGLIFIFVQSVTLGFVALLVIVVQIGLIPRMRRRLLVLGRERQLTARQFAGRVGEIVEGIASIHTNDTSNFERATVSAELGRIFLIRLDIYQWKFLVKFLNNFLSQVTPFIFYVFGGYFAIHGQLDIGQLVAVIAAYKELPSPLKDLLDWDQSRLDVTVKYEQVAEQFDIAGIADAGLQSPPDMPVAPLKGSFSLAEVSARDEMNGQLLDDVSLDIPLVEQVAAVGDVGGGAEALAEILARLRPPSQGVVTLAGRPMEELPQAVTGQRLAYLDGSTYFAQATLRDALLYPLKHRPVRPVDAAETKIERLARRETVASGNTTLDIRADWIDLDAAGAADLPELRHIIGEVLRTVMLDRDVHLLGLRSRVPDRYEHLVAEPILKSRAAFRERLTAAAMDAFVEPFDPDRYMTNATIMENLTFGAARGPNIELARYYVMTHVRTVLTRTGLAETLAEIGREIATTMVDLFGDLEPGNPLLQRLSVMAPEELEDYRQIVMRTGGRSVGEAQEADVVAFVRLALRYFEPRHRLGLVDDALKERLVEARKVFRKSAPEELGDLVAFHAADTYNPAATIEDNVLFGRIAYDFANASGAVEALLLGTLDDLGLAEIVQEAGLFYDIGVNAKRLSVAQQHKLALARCLLKSPDFLIVNRGLSSLDPGHQEKIIAATLERGASKERPFGTFWVLASEQHAFLFKKVLRFEGGRIVAPPPAAEGFDEAPLQQATG